MKPLALVSTVTPLTFVVFRPTAVVEAGALLPLPPEAGAVLLDELPQAASAAAATAAAGSTRSIRGCRRGCRGACGRTYVLFIGFPFATWTASLPCTGPTPTDLRKTDDAARAA